MLGNRGGRREGAGRKVGSKNKNTIAKEAVAEVLEVDDADRLEQAIHKRGHRLLVEMERIAVDHTQPVAARIMAAKTALPFLLPRQAEQEKSAGMSSAEFGERLNRGRSMALLLEQQRQQRTQPES